MQLLTDRGHTAFAIAWVVLMLVFMSNGYAFGAVAYAYLWAFLLLVPLVWSRIRLRKEPAGSMSLQRQVLGVVSAGCEFAMLAVLIIVYTRVVLLYCYSVRH